VRKRAERRMCAKCKERPARPNRWLCKVCDPKAAKYSNTVVRDPVEGKFDSIGEARRWRELRLWEAAGAIKNLQRQVRHVLDVNGVHITTYVTDHEYDVITNVPGRKPGDHVIEDYKGAETEAFRMKARLLLAIEGLHVTLVRLADLGG